MSFPLINPTPQFFDSSGSPLSSGTIEFRDPATNALINSYPTADDADAQTNANDNPLTLNARGEAASGLYLEEGTAYKVILKDSEGATVWTQDDVRCPVFSQSSIGKRLYPQTSDELAAGVTPTNYQYLPGDVRRYGAVDDGTTDSTSAFTTLDSWMDYRWNTLGLASTAYIVGDFVLSSTVTFSATYGNFYYGGSIRASNSFTNGDYLLIINAPQSKHFGPRLLCEHRAAGMDILSGVTKVFSPLIAGFHTYGLSFSTNGSADSFAYDVHITQWGLNESEFQTDANFDGVGVWMDRNDVGIQGGVVRWSGTNVLFGSNCGTSWIRDVHPYNGRPNGAARVDPINIEVEAGATGIAIRNCYIDHGIVKLFSPSVTIEGCEWLAGGVNATFSNSALIEVYPSQASDPGPGELNIDVDTPVNLGSGYQMVKFLTTGSNTWAGDYSAVSAQTRRWLKTHNGRIEVFHQNANSINALHRYKPGGQIDIVHEIGTNGPITERYIGTRKEYKTPIRLANYTVSSLPGAGIKGQMIYVTDATGGEVPAFSDGSSWRRVTDRAVIS